MKTTAGKEDLGPLFVYANSVGKVRVEASGEASILAGDPDWQHIASIEPRTYIQTILNQNVDLVAALKAANLPT